MSYRILALSCLFALAAGCDLGAFDAGASDGDGGVSDPDFLPPDAGFADECGTCHGDENSPAPPRDTRGDTDTSIRTVGAHRSHLNTNSNWHGPMKCENCHVVPGATSDPGHLDGDGVAEVTFGGVATAAGSSPSWNGTTCTNAYCHGATLSGGALTEPTWTTVDGTQKACGNCHGNPPPAPHPQETNCGACHPTIQPGTTTFLDPDSHINGVIDFTGTAEAACDSCHGSDTVSAPPKALDGTTARTSPGVGAHRDHLGTSPWRKEIVCSDCHVVPTEVSSAGHIDGDNIAEITFGNLNPTGTFDHATSTCANLYCHGNGFQTAGSAVWTDQTDLACTACHATNGTGMSGDHRRHINGERTPCSDCHQSVVDANQTVIAPELHVDGLKQVVFRRGGTYNPATRTCSNIGCHGSERW